jgi:hypothetical protein
MEAIDTLWASVAVAYGLTQLTVFAGYVHGLVSIKRDFRWSWHKLAGKVSITKAILLLFGVPYVAAVVAVLFGAFSIYLATLI